MRKPNPQNSDRLREILAQSSEIINSPKLPTTPTQPQYIEVPKNA